MSILPVKELVFQFFFKFRTFSINVTARKSVIQHIFVAKNAKAINYMSI